MEREFKKGDLVTFGNGNGAKSIGVVVKVAPGGFKQQRVSVSWNFLDGAIGHNLSNQLEHLNVRV